MSALFSFNNETIVAPITPAGQGAVGILRISGPESFALMEQCFRRKFKPRVATRANFFNLDGEILDEGLVIFFKGPHSFTGEDSFEFQGHGSPVLMKILLNLLLTFPHVRIARPGEFSERAFLNGKIDLVQAEAIADLIRSESHSETLAAVKSLQGIFSKKIFDLEKTILTLRTPLEAHLDFIEEEFSSQEKENFFKKITDFSEELEKLFVLAKKNCSVHPSFKIGLIGAPNVGKSSLFNLLFEEDRSIVTDVEGTTRDFITENIEIKDHLFSIIDTAGIRHSEDVVENIGIQKTQKLGKCFDMALWVENAFSPAKKDENPILENILLDLQVKNIPILGIWNKIDLVEKKNPSKPSDFHRRFSNTWINISCTRADGIEHLKKHLITQRTNDNSSAEFLVRKRHLDLLEKSFFLSQRLNQQIKDESIEWDKIAHALCDIHQYIGKITGKTYSEELLNSIFSSFCLGK